jgi:AcrR family transcriptional regulator
MAEGLRERKKRMTREAIFAAADRLFAERGFEAVTVAEIADAANVSVKTLFTYVRSKEDLVFDDDAGLLADIAAAVRTRAADVDPATRATHRLTAALVVALVRTIISPEVRALVAEQPDAEAQDVALRQWLRTAAERIR